MSHVAHIDESCHTHECVAQFLSLCVCVFLSLSLSCSPPFPLAFFVLLSLLLPVTSSPPPTLTRQPNHCDTLQHTTTRYNTWHHAATHCNTLLYAATHCNTLRPLVKGPALKVPLTNESHHIASCTNEVCPTDTQVKSKLCYVRTRDIPHMNELLCIEMTT